MKILAPLFIILTCSPLFSCKSRNFNANTESVKVGNSTEQSIMAAINVDGTSLSPTDASTKLIKAFQQVAANKESIFNLYSARIAALDAELKAGNISKKAHCDTKTAIYNRISSEAGALQKTSKISADVLAKVNERKNSFAGDCVSVSISDSTASTSLFDSMMADGFGLNENLLNSDASAIDTLVEIGKAIKASASRLSLLLLDSEKSHNEISTTDYCQKRSQIVSSLIQDMQKSLDAGTYTSETVNRMKSYADYFHSFYCPGVKP